MPRPLDPTLPHPSRAYSGNPGLGLELLGLRCRAVASAHVTKHWGALEGHGTPALSTSGECHHVTYPACLLVARSVPRASEQSFPQDPKPDSSCAQGTSSPRGTFVAYEPMSQTLGWGRGLSPLSTDLGPKPLRDVAHQDSICVFGDCSQHQPRWNLSSPFSLEMLQSPRCPFVDAAARCSLPVGPSPCSWLQGLWLLGRAGTQAERTLRPLQPSRSSAVKGVGRALVSMLRKA